MPAIAPPGRPGRHRRGVLPVAAVAAVVVSAAVLVAALASQGETPDAYPSVPAATVVVTERGDPAGAARLTDQADELSTSDPRQALRLRIAASVLAPDRLGYRLAVAAAVLDDVTPAPITSGSLDPGGPVSYATIAADGSFVVTNRDRGQVWHTYDPGRNRAIREPVTLAEPITAAAASIAGDGANLIVNTPSGVYGMLSTPALTRDGTRMTDPIDLVATTVGGDVAVTVHATTATLWQPGLFSTQTLAVLPYDRPVTAVSFAPSTQPILAAGHDDGSVTVDVIDLAVNSTTRRTLTGGDRAPVASVAVSRDGSTVLAVTVDGTATVWPSNAQEPQPTTSVTAGGSVAVGGRGPYQTWLSPRGEYAVIADTATAPALWSMVDGQPTRLLDLRVGGDPAVPAMVSYDGRALVTIGRDNTLALWDLSSIVDTLDDPLPRACPLAQLTEQAWRDIVPDTTYANPCPQTGPPTLGATTSIRANGLRPPGTAT